MKTLEEKFVEEITGTGGFHNPHTPENEQFFNQIIPLVGKGGEKVFMHYPLSIPSTDITPIAKHGDHFMCVATFNGEKGVYRGEPFYDNGNYSIYKAIPCEDEDEFIRICGWQDGD